MPFRKILYIPGLLTLLFVLSPACGPQELGEEGGYDVPVLSVKMYNLTASEAAKQYCSTSSVNGLTQQLFKELNCLRSGTLTDFSSFSGVKKSSSNVNAFLQTAAANSLKKVLARRSGSSMTITSALRSLAQQYLLYRWYKLGRCGIGLAASPGNSNHESALALDLSNYSSWKSAFQAEGWRWLGSSDPVHYDFKGSGTVTLKGLSIKAFQRLWNKNNPNDKIAEDGQYGPNTEARLAKSPAGGFANAGCNVAPTPKLEAVHEGTSFKGTLGKGSGGLYAVCPGQSFQVMMTFKNTGNVNWSDVNQTTHGKAVRLGFKGGEQWGVPARISINTASVKDVKPSDSTTFTLNAKAPTATGTSKSEWQIVSESVAWFGPIESASIDVTNAPPGAGAPCSTGQYGTCNDGEMGCKDGKLVCLSKAPCGTEPATESVNEPAEEKIVTPDDGGSEPVSEPSPQPDSSTGEEVTSTWEPSVPEKKGGEILKLESGGKTSCQAKSDCPGTQSCVEGVCQDASFRVGGAGCACDIAAGRANSPISLVWSLCWMLLLLGAITRRRR